MARKQQDLVAQRTALQKQVDHIAWTGEGEINEDFFIGERVYALNPYFRDGTRLRLGPDKESKFSDQHVLNDAEVEILELENGFARVTTCDSDTHAPCDGWLRARNLTRVKRASGLSAQQKERARGPQAVGGMRLQRGKTISNLQPATVDEDLDAAKETSSAGIDRLMTTQSFKMSKMDEYQRKKLRSEIRQQAVSLGNQLRRRQRLTLDPHSRLMHRWDSLVVMALIFTAIVTPYEFCVLPPVPLDELLYDPLSWVNRFVDLVFISDIVVQCFLAYQEPPEKV